jgi:hypothetical protein
VAHTCNPGGRDQEDHNSKPAPGKQFVRTYLENTYHKKAGGVAQDEGSEFKYCKEKKVAINDKAKTGLTVESRTLAFNPQIEIISKLGRLWFQEKTEAALPPAGSTGPAPVSQEAQEDLLPLVS